jgi:hypothetical protein
MKRGYNVLRRAVKQSPLVLLGLDEHLQEIANKMFPISGVEIECGMGEDFEHAYETRSTKDFLREHLSPFFPNKERFVTTSHVDNAEQRYLFSSGIEGMIQVYYLCEFLQEYSIFNEGSGIHYNISDKLLHEDKDLRFLNLGLMQDSSFHELLSNLLQSQGKTLLSNINTWGYNGRYMTNKRVSIGRNTSDYVCWRSIQRSCDFLTTIDSPSRFEIRVGEMAFDYETMCKRIIQGYEFVKGLRVFLKTVFSDSFIFKIIETDNVFMYKVKGRLKEHVNWDSERFEKAVQFMKAIKEKGNAEGDARNRQIVYQFLFSFFAEIDKCYRAKDFMFRFFEPLQGIQYHVSEEIERGNSFQNSILSLPKIEGPSNAFEII